MALTMLNSAIARTKPPAICIDEKSKQSWMQQRYWQDIERILSNSFKGQELFEGVVFVGDEKKRAREREALEDEVDIYLALYSMLSFGWSEIQEKLSGIELPVTIPGEAFAYILAGRLNSIQNRLNKSQIVNSRGLYNAYLQYKKCAKLEKSGSVLQKEVDELNKLIGRLKKKDNEPISESVLFEDACVDICLRSKKEKIQYKAKIYERARARRCDLVAAELRYA